MKTYFQNGILGDTSFFADGSNGFLVQEVEHNPVDRYIYPGDSIKYELDGELVTLYDKLRDLFFVDTAEYYEELNIMPIFVQEAGQNSDCEITRDTFDKLIQEETVTQIPNFIRHLYLVDCQFLVGTIQNLLSGMEDTFTSYYVRIADIGNTIAPNGCNTTIHEMSQAVRCLSSSLENYFTKAYSILDMFCKLAYEFEFPIEDFSSYRKLKSADVLWGRRKKLHVNESPRTVFEKCELISTIEALRNEVVHNGSWELNPKVFVTFENGTIAERHMLFPDIVDGHLATVKNRKHFFGSGNKVNEVLPQIHMEYMERVLNTARLLNRLELNR